MNQNTLFISRDGVETPLSEAALRQALADDEARLGPDHADVGIGLNNLAAVLLETGRAQEALPLIARARDIMLGAFEGDHPYKRATYATLVAVVRQVDAEGATPPNLRPFAAQIRAADATSPGAPEETPPQAAPPQPTPPPQLERIEVTPLAAPAAVAPAREPQAIAPEKSASPLGALGDLIFGARPPRRR